MEENNVLIPEGWEKVKFSEYISFQEGPGLMSFLFREVGFPFINIRCIENGNINKESCQFLSEEIAQNQYKHFQLEENDLIVSTSGTLGKKAFVKKSDLPLLLNTSIIRFKPKDTDVMSLNFLNFLLEDNSFLYNLYSQSTGSAQVNVGPTHLKKLFITIPKTSKEQNKIAEILSKVDNAISETEIIIAKYNRIKTGLIQDLLTKGIDEKGNIRSEETHEFKDSPLGRIPKEWDCLELRKCIELHNNKRKPISALVRAKMIGEFPYYGATGIIDNLNIYNVEGEFVLFGEDGDHFLKWRKQEQTILVDGKFNVSNHAHIVKGNCLCSSKWLHYFYFHRDITFYLTRQGAGRFKLNKESLLSLPVLVPKDFNEQIRIIDKIEYLNNFINHHKIQNNKLQSTKTGLMQDLLSGKKRVTHLIN